MPGLPFRKGFLRSIGIDAVTCNLAGEGLRRKPRLLQQREHQIGIGMALRRKGPSPIQISHGSTLYWLQVAPNTAGFSNVSSKSVAPAKICRDICAETSTCSVSVKPRNTHCA